MYYMKFTRLMKWFKGILLRSVLKRENIWKVIGYLAFFLLNLKQVIWYLNSIKKEAKVDPRTENKIS